MLIASVCTAYSIQEGYQVDVLPPSNHRHRDVILHVNASKTVGVLAPNLGPSIELEILAPRGTIPRPPNFFNLF